MNGDAGSGGRVIDQLETNGCDDTLFHRKAQMTANDVAAITSGVDVQSSIDWQCVCSIRERRNCHYG